MQVRHSKLSKHFATLVSNSSFDFLGNAQVLSNMKMTCGCGKCVDRSTSSASKARAVKKGCTSNQSRIENLQKQLTTIRQPVCRIKNQPSVYNYQKQSRWQVGRAAAPSTQVRPSESTASYCQLSPRKELQCLQTRSSRRLRQAEPVEHQAEQLTARRSEVASLWILCFPNADHLKT